MLKNYQNYTDIIRIYNTCFAIRYDCVYFLIKLKMKMQVLKLTCTIVIIAGCFRPLSWTSLFKRTVYNIYRLYVISMVSFFSISQFMDIVLNVDNADDFTNNLNMLLTSSAACYKIFIMWFNYKRISTLINYLIKEPFKPLDPYEMEIRWRFDKTIR